MPEVKINIKAIPKIETMLLSSSFLNGVEAFYQNPKNMADFEKWKAERDRRANVHKKTY